MDNDTRIADALERIATALERPTLLPIYRRHITIDEVEHFTQQLKELAPHVQPVFINTQAGDTQPNGQTPQLMGLLS